MEMSSREIAQANMEDPVGAAIARSRDKAGNLVGNEYCNSCGGDMGFSIHTHTEHPDRFKDGALYRDGAGQTCGSCEKKLSTS
jgi:hypothetical protein